MPSARWSRGRPVCSRWLLPLRAGHFVAGLVLEPSASPYLAVGNAAIDRTPLEQTFTQLQQRENFYGFPAKLDVDRYRVGGELQDYVVAVRELETASLGHHRGRRHTSPRWVRRSPH